jgi:hypothetical protein
LVPELVPELPALPDVPEEIPGQGGIEPAEPMTPTTPAETTFGEAGETEAQAIADLCKQYEGLCEWEEWERIPPR